MTDAEREREHEEVAQVIGRLFRLLWETWPGEVWRGEARQGGAWRGTAWQGRQEHSKQREGESN